MQPDPTPSAEQIPFPRQAALWKALSDGADLRARAQGWAELMAAQLQEEPGLAVLGVCGFRFDGAAQRMVPLGLSPANRTATPLMVQTAQTAAEQGRPTARGDLPAAETGRAEGPMCAAVPLAVADRVVGVACAELHPEDEAAMRRAMRRLQWGAAWLRDQLRAEWAEDREVQHRAAVEALNTVVAVAEREDFDTAARAAVTDLATRFDCDRVALGMRRLRSTRVRAISHSAQFSRRMKLVRKLAAAMDEAIDQRAAVLWPEPEGEDGALATMMAEDLARDDTAGQVFTVPLYAAGRFVGALTFERPADRAFSQSDVEILEAVGTVLAPILEEKRRNDRWLATKAAEVAGNQLRRLLGPSHLLRKLVAAALIGLGVFFWYATGPFQIGAEAQVVGTEERAIVPSFDGFVAAAPVRAGATVAAGDLLVLLDDRDLVLERQRLVTLRQRQQIEYDRAVAARDRAEISIRLTMIEQADAEIGLIDEQLARTRLVAPFDGLVLSGDLSQSIGSSVSRGETLMVVAPADAYRVKLQVDERQIAEVAPGQTASLRVTALPSETFRLRIDKITPVATYAEGRTTFEVEATFLGSAAALRPGMEGAARIEVDERRLIEIWTRPLIDWARVTLWRWSPV